MSEEMVELLKELVDRIKTLESTVYDSDNILMKSGFVKVDGPTPKVAAPSVDGLPDNDTIAKMSWEDINKLVSKMEGGVQ
jgi:DNA replicative helicase MCM subunit Mcm2 (Cdc46/Mcm family)